MSRAIGTKRRWRKGWPKRRRQPPGTATDRVATGDSEGPADPIFHKAQRHEEQKPSRRPGSSFMEAGRRFLDLNCRSQGFTYDVVQSSSLLGWQVTFGQMVEYSFSTRAVLTMTNMTCGEFRATAGATGRLWVERKPGASPPFAPGYFPLSLSGPKCRNSTSCLGNPDGVE